MARSDRATHSRIRLAAHELARLERDLSGLRCFLDRKSILRETLHVLRSAFGFHCAWSAEFSGSKTVLVRHADGNVSNVLDQLKLRSGYGIGGKVFASGKTDWVDDYCTSSTITHHYDHAARSENLKGVIATPLRANGEVTGVLLAGTREESTFGNRAATIMELAAQRSSEALIVADRARTATELAVQAERQRMALDLHDTVGAMLFAITAGVRNLTETTADANVKKNLLAIEQQARDAAVALRESLRALQSPKEQIALGVALQTVLHGFEVRTGINAELVIIDLLPALREETVRLLIAAAKEGLLNVEKHARATEVAVTVARMKDGTALTVTDNGIGFHGTGGKESSSADHGFGLQALAKALEAIGGALQVSENADGGTSFRAWVRN